MHLYGNARLTSVNPIPGRVLATWSLVTAFFIPIVGLVLGVVALGQSRRAGVSNNLAVAGIAVSIVLGFGATITTIAIWA